RQPMRLPLLALQFCLLSLLWRLVTFRRDERRKLNPWWRCATNEIDCRRRVMGYGIGWVSIGSNFRTPGTTTHTAFGNQRYRLSHFRDFESRKWTPLPLYDSTSIAKPSEINLFYSLGLMEQHLILTFCPRLSMMNLRTASVRMAAL